MEIELPPDFKEFLRLLNAHQVEYLLIGGYAVGYYGYPRATNDLDIWIAVHPANANNYSASSFTAEDLRRESLRANYHELVTAQAAVLGGPLPAPRTAR